MNPNPNQRTWSIWPSNKPGDATEAFEPSPNPNLNPNPNPNP